MNLKLPPDKEFLRLMMLEKQAIGEGAALQSIYGRFENLDDISTEPADAASNARRTRLSELSELYDLKDEHINRLSAMVRGAHNATRPSPRDVRARGPTPRVRYQPFSQAVNATIRPAGNKTKEDDM